MKLGNFAVKFWAENKAGNAISADNGTPGGVHSAISGTDYVGQSPKPVQIIQQYIWMRNPMMITRKFSSGRSTTRECGGIPDNVLTKVNINWTQALLVGEFKTP